MKACFRICVRAIGLLAVSRVVAAQQADMIRGRILSFREAPLSDEEIRSMRH